MIRRVHDSAKTWLLMLLTLIFRRFVPLCFSPSGTFPKAFFCCRDISGLLWRVFFCHQPRRTLSPSALGQPVKIGRSEGKTATGYFNSCHRNISTWERYLVKGTPTLHLFGSRNAANAIVLKPTAPAIDMSSFTAQEAGSRSWG